MRTRLSGLQYLVQMESLARGSICLAVDGGVVCGMVACVPLTAEALGGLLASKLGSFDLKSDALVAKPNRAKAILVTNFLNLFEGKMAEQSGARAIFNLRSLVVILASRFLAADGDVRIIATADHFQGTRAANNFGMKNLNIKTRLSESLWECPINDSLRDAMAIQRCLEGASWRWVGK
jgi:hypothetical protein